MPSQMQEEINLIQITDLHISDWIYTQEERAGIIGVAGVRPGGAAISGSIEPKSPISPITPEILQNLARSQDDSINKLNSITDQQSNLLREIKALQTTVSNVNLNASPLNPRDRIGSPNAINTNQPQTSELSNSIKASSEQVSQLKSRMEEQIQQLKMEVGRLSNSLSVNSIPSSYSASSGFGWFPYLMLSFTTFCVASLTYHTFTQHMKNQRYKMI